MKLYDNAFSPFARKVRMVLDHKELDCDVVDGLDKSNHDALKAMNGRIEVPTLDDGGVAVANSADIVSYLEHRYPEKPVYPSDPGLRAQARAWERCADSVIDPILVDISYWMWADRPDDVPAGLVEAAQADLEQIYDALERDLNSGDYVCGDFSIADIALFPHLAAVHTLGVSYSPKRHPNIGAWLSRTRKRDICRADLDRVRAYLGSLSERNLETKRIFWRGDRIEWLLARGYHDWFMGEIAADRVLWPGLGIPGPRG